MTTFSSALKSRVASASRVIFPNATAFSTLFSSWKQLLLPVRVLQKCCTSFIASSASSTLAEETCTLRPPWARNSSNDLRKRHLLSSPVMLSAAWRLLTELNCYSKMSRGCCFGNQEQNRCCEFTRRRPAWKNPRLY